MRKKFLSVLMLGLLAVGTTSTIVSCKDYDDDISALKESKADLTALNQQKADLEKAIADLKSQLETTNGKVTTIEKELSSAKGDITKNASAIEALQKSMNEAQAKISAIETQIGTLQEADAKLEKLIKELQDNKVDKEQYAFDLKDIYGKIESVQTDLGNALKDIEGLKKGLQDEETARKAAVENLQQQIDALNAYKARVEKNEGDIATINGQIKDLTEKLTQAQKDIKDNAKSISDLTTTMNELSKSVSALQDDINILNVLVKKNLRSLVFQPDLYYWGVEGTKLLTLNCEKWNLEATAWNHIESVFDPAHLYYTKTNTFRVLDFTANYHMNPSTADKKLIKDVKVISDDKDFYDDATHSRAAACGLYVANWDANAGMLNVNLGVQDKSKIKTVANDKQITVFAAQAYYADTTITSDYATLIKEEVNNLYLYHHDKAHGAPTTYGRANTHTCGACGINAELLHLYANPYEAGIDYLPQDSCNWNETLDLRKLVGTHYTAASGEKEFNVEKYGLTYKFELTGLYLEGNKTSESAHAAINPEDGYTFKPQMPVYDAQLVGTQQTYAKGVQGRQTIGRTPLVRVSLVDKTDGTVYAYGYIRIKITEPGVPPVLTENKYITYETNKDWTYNQECSYPAWEYQTTWIQTEYDIYNMVKNTEVGGITREEFEAIYEPDYASGYEFNQYKMTTAGTAQSVAPVYEENVKVTYYDNGTFASQNKIGTVVNVPDASVSEDGTRTSIIKWTMTGAQAYDYFVTHANKSATTAVLYKSTKAGYPNIYVVLQSGTATVTKPSAVANWAADIISNYWYSTDANVGKSGTDEIHAQVLTPEDAPTKGKTVADFSDMFSDVFNGNFSNGIGNILTVTGASAANKLRVADLDPSLIDFVFDAKNNGLVFNGLENSGYKMSVADNGKTLKATLGLTTQVVATIVGTNYKDQYVKLEETDYAKDLLNAKHHSELAAANYEKSPLNRGQAIYAVIGLAPVKPCDYKMDIVGTFNVRFLRPLNVKSSDKSIEDANVQKVQDIKMVDLVLFNDWRDAWDNKEDVWGPYTYDASGNWTNYSKYYQIKAIKVLGVNDGDNIALCPQAKTNLGLNATDAADESKWVALSTVSNQVDFIYHEGTNGLASNYIRYRNLSSSLSEFKVKVPVVVSYYWGDIKGYATITVYPTHHNGAK